MERFVSLRAGSALVCAVFLLVGSSSCGTKGTESGTNLKKPTIPGFDGGPGGPDAGLDVAEADALGAIARAMQSFHQNTGGWPYSDQVWWGDNRNASTVSINGEAFSPYDTAMFQLANGGSTTCVNNGCENLTFTSQQCTVAQCPTGDSGGTAGPCWNGPYLVGSANVGLGSPAWYDAWGRPRMFAYLPPYNGCIGGGNGAAPNGIIVIWSTGADGVDSYGCTSGTCAVSYTKFAAGEPSGEDSDDIIDVVANSAL